LQKLEETVAENARLEQDLVVLRQKLQASRRYAGNVQIRDTSGTTAALEKELRRVQQLVGDLQRQRQELSIQVRQLTEKSHSLVQQIRPQATSSKSHHVFSCIDRSIIGKLVALILTGYFPLITYSSPGLFK
jgi:predicted nuclease with TOPRIM domain